ncbi:MAG: hypothetical protein QOC61_2005 [Acidobacteriota bacterium]|jgi:hypothetical protein|nr:hypothetical protein [Acidobacteriota bacterium]MDT5263001.1 hypothetical protein [Acidobacteriota bacterium]MDT7780902.1 hypothetical protein [Acidobacteriota bacterium]
MKWDEIFGRIFRGGLRRGALGVSRAAPKLTRAAADSLAEQVARSTFRIFKNNLLTLPWIKEGEQLSAALDGARADLLRSWNAHRESLKSKRAAARAEADWHRVTGDFRRHIADLNRRIAAYNLKAPSPTFRKSPVDADREIGRIMRDE